MTDESTYKGWSNCSECGYEDIFVFSLVDGEDYTEEGYLGFMFDATCPACEDCESVLVLSEQFDEMKRLAEMAKR
ncbi:MAG: hypothetical protein DRQ37_03635 [Gammaproteobacteria bacterium]|nr:MAG: hypothetical protein DRQ37_03635 [Gammaproteobacteria bacterium]